MHFKVGHWPGELLPLVWNNWAPFMVPWSQRVSEVSRKFGAGGRSGVIGCCGCSQLCNSDLCAVIDLADALQCQFHAALTDLSHCHLSLWVRDRVCSSMFLNSMLDNFGISFLPMLYCSQMLVLISRSLTLFSFFDVVCHFDGPIVVSHSSVPILIICLPIFCPSGRAVCFHSSVVVVFASWLWGIHG